MEWQVHFVPPFHSQLEKTPGNFALGVCDDTTKEIYINKNLKGNYLKRVLTHELTHAAAYSYGANLTYEEHEFLAEFVAHNGKKIIETTDKIFKNYKKK